MRTRNQSKRLRQSTGDEDMMELLHESEANDSANLTNTSRVGVSKLLKRVNSRGSCGSKKQDSCAPDCDSTPELESGLKGKEKQVPGARDEAENSSGDVNLKTPSKAKVEGGSIQQAKPDMEYAMDESDWEDGSPMLSSRNDHSDVVSKGVTIDFDASPDTAKRKPIRRASAEDKELAELVHRVHLLCLLGRGRLIDTTCSDPLIQVSLLSLMPTNLLKITEVTKLTANDLGPLVNWFHNNFHVRSPSSTERSFHSALVYALETREGTPEEVAALSVALFRALNLSTRFVSILDAASLKPEADESKSISQDASRARRGIFDSSTVMVSHPNHISISPIRLGKENVAYDDKKNACATSVKGLHKSQVNKSTQSISQMKNSPIADQFNDKRLDSPACEAENAPSDACLIKRSKVSKRKGDIEFEMQLEMALTATAAETSELNHGSNVKDLHSCSSNFSPFKRLKKIRSEGSSSSSQGISTAVGAKKVGAPMYWAEVYCSGENSTGKWMHVDAVNAIIDGEQKVEAAAAACKLSLRYAVAFAGQGAKDVTRRYCAKWYKIASQRVNSTWWDAVLAPLRELESRATGGVVHLKQEVHNKHKNTEAPKLLDHSTLECPPDTVSLSGNSTVVATKENGENTNESSSLRSSFVATRTSLEDMELEIKALTEPLPTNQQAYRSHHLYALERWLTKYQILHPKGPILGFCSGHPVYPRACVQTLHTKERWLREGMQIKVNELPVKVLERSLKPNKAQVPDPDDYDQSNCGELGGSTSLYGKWQTEPLCLPRAVNGIVPKNERGQVDVWSEKCLPPGTVHLGLPRVFVIAKRLEIDFAPAMVGFEFRNGRSFPLYNGIVVCAEFKDAILQVYAEEEERREAEERKKNEAQAISRWYQLLLSIVTRQRLNNRYGVGVSSHTSNDIKQSDKKFHEPIATSEEDKQNSGCHQTDIHDSKPHAMQQVFIEENHEHIFTTVDQGLGEESSIRTKRCHCGFSIQVEEL